MINKDHVGSKASNKESAASHFSFPIIAVGGSAGSIKAFEEFVRELPSDIGMAIVFIQHLDPNYPSDLVRIISKETKLEVVSAKDGEDISPNHIYIMPPNKELTLYGYTMQLGPRDKSKTPFLPIDSFLISLARTGHQNMIAVILSGLGSDGCLGVKEIGSVGGLVFAQSAESAENFSMPSEAIETGYVDFVLTPQQIAEEIINIKKYPLLSQSEIQQDNEGINELEKVFFMIKKHMNIDFTNYKKSTIKRRIQRRMIILKKETIQDYIEHLLVKTDEVELLCQDLLIGVTRFFRDQEVFEVLKEKVYPKIIEENIANNPIRIWVPACSTGEEAYSIAMSFIEFLGERIASTQIQIFATDVSEKFILNARTGHYPKNIEKDVSKERLNRFFIETDQGYQVSKFVREMCVFAIQNVITDPPFSRMDLISCRNLLIYFDSTLQRKVFISFHYSLNPRGFLLLGSSETIGSSGDFFKTVDKKYKFYSKKKLNKNIVSIPFVTHKEREKIRKDTILKTSTLIDEKQVIRHANQILLDMFCPVSVIVEDDFNILQIRGDATYFLSPPAGASSYNLMKMAKEELRSPLRLILEQASLEQRAISRDDIRLKFANLIFKVELKVYPFSISAYEKKYFIVTFTQFELPAVKVRDLENIDSEANDLIKEKDKEIIRLEQQLNETREHLKIVINEHDRKNDELKSLNEEVLSSNEELQSTNEDLQTSKEEVQSSNEELNTLNDELQIRNQELVQVLDDLNNFISAIQIPVVFINLDLNIRRITSSKDQVLDLLPKDIGSSILNLKIARTIPHFEKRIHKVIKNDIIDKVEVTDQSGHCYSMMIIPFKDHQGQVQGAMISFYDISVEKLALQKQIELAKVMDVSIDAIIIMSLDGKILSWNQGAVNQYGYSADEALKMYIDDIIPESKKLDNIKLRAKVLEEEFVKSAYCKRITKSGEVLDIWLTATVIKDVSGKPIQITTSERDMCEQIQKENFINLQKDLAEKANIQKTSFLANMSHEIRTPLSSIVGFAELLEIQENLSQSTKDSYLQRIQQSGKHLSELIDDILDLTKIEAGQLHIERMPFSPRKEVETVISSFRTTAEKHGIEFNVIYHGDIPDEIVSDPTRIRQILFNLIGNSIKFTQSGGIYITIKFKQESARFIFNVKDTGCGIESNKLSRIFDPFNQADDSMTRRYGGTGLGLGLSRKLAELMGGELYLVESEVGKGSTFEFYIPVASSHFNHEEDSQILTALKKEKMEHLTGILQKVSVLIVEDGVDNQILFKKILEIAGATVKIIDNGIDAFEEAKDHEYDVILMDIQLPDMEGKEVTRKLRYVGYKGPIIGITAHAFEEDKQLALEAGLDDYKTKPIPAEQLIRLVHDWVHKKQS